MPRPLRLALIALTVAATACAARAIPADPGPPNEPRASWTLRVGPSRGRGQIVCRSDMPSECIVRLRPGEQPVFVAVAAYLYPASEKTTYKGYFFSSFLGDYGYESVVNYEADPMSRPALMSHFGPVVEAPGSYEFRLILSAEIDGRPTPRQFEIAVPVRVVAAES